MFFATLITLSLAGAVVHAQSGGPTDWITVTSKCNRAMINQIETELNAAMTYMSMGAHFSLDTVNRPGFAEYFFKSATEERGHAIKLIEYLLMRGKLTGGDVLEDRNRISEELQTVQNIIQNPKPHDVDLSTGLSALKDALKLETNVTQSIKHIIEVCESSPDKNNENFNDYHLVDYLTGEFLTEQYEGQRELAGKISTLEKMIASHNHIGEFLFDKQNM